MRRQWTASESGYPIAEGIGHDHSTLLALSAVTVTVTVTGPCCGNAAGTAPS
jgi:hypothetical protein